MKYRFVIRILLTATSLMLPAQALYAQADIFNNVYWKAMGKGDLEQLGFNGLNNLGSISDSVPHAIAFSTYNSSALILNRFPLDTVTHFKFPGTDIYPCHLNRDPYQDVVCADMKARTVTFLLGTASPDSFTTAVVLRSTDNRRQMYLIVKVVTADLDSDGFDDVVISDYAYSDTHGNPFGRLLYFRGGDTLSQTPTEVIEGILGVHHIGFALGVGHVRDKSKMFLIEAHPEDYVLYPFVSPFHFIPEDTVHLRSIVATDGSYGGGFLVTDANGDSIDDFLVGHLNQLLVYYGGDSIKEQPTFRIHKHFFGAGSSTYGSMLVNVHDITGNGYPSLLVTDPEQDMAGGYFGGTVWLYNMGRALKDTCVAYGSVNGFERYFGNRAAAASDFSGDGRSDFLVSQDPPSASDSHIIHVGEVDAFLGAAKYGPKLSVISRPLLPNTLRLDQNFPNPASDATDITFAVGDLAVRGRSVTVQLFDALGRQLKTIFEGTADGFGYRVRIDTRNFRSGAYTYRLTCGESSKSHTMTILH